MSPQKSQEGMPIGKIPVLLDSATYGQQRSNRQESLDSLYLADDVDRAIRSGVKFLVELQEPSGMIADRSHGVTMTSLAIMAMAAIGTQPVLRSTAGRSMKRAIEYVLSDKQDDDGYFGSHDRSRMYGHGITTLMLSEILGMGDSPAQNERIRKALVKAIELILAAQAVSKPEKLRGGWRYTPDSRFRSLGDGLAIDVVTIR